MKTSSTKLHDTIICNPYIDEMQPWIPYGHGDPYSVTRRLLNEWNDTRAGRLASTWANAGNQPWEEQDHERWMTWADSAYKFVELRVTRVKNQVPEFCSNPRPTLSVNHRPFRRLPTEWTATDGDPATTGLKVSVTQDPAKKTASGYPLRLIRPYYPPGQSRTTPDGRCGSN